MRRPRVGSIIGVLRSPSKQINHAGEQRYRTALNLCLELRRRERETLESLELLETDPSPEDERD